MEILRSPEAASTRPLSRSLSCLVGLLALVGMTFVAGCGPDETAQKVCESHGDCETGKICSDNNECEAVPCSFCEDMDELICYEPSGEGEATCSAPECEKDADCTEPGETCEGGQCTSEVECSSNSDCEGAQICNLDGECEAPTDAGSPDAGTDEDVGGDVGTDTSTEDDTGMETDAGGGDAGGCGNCDSDEVCDEATGQCTSPDCNETKDCSQKPDANIWDSDLCACVECEESSDCSDGQACRGGICQTPCPDEQKCGSNNGGADSCGGDRPFCVSECCVECVGSSDCSDGKVCVDSQCQEEPDDCLAGGSCSPDQKCEDTDGDGEGECVEGGGSGQSCDPTNPGSCPQGEFCNQQGQCEAPSSGQNCGLCGSNCSCPGSSTCQQFACTGCEGVLAPDDCPDDQVCYPAGDAGLGVNVCGPPLL